MSTDQKMCIIVYSLVMIQCSITITVILCKAKRTPAVISLCIAQLLVVLWLFFGMIENMSRTTQELLMSVRFTLFPICFIGGLWLLFALFYAELITIKNKLMIGLIFAPLAITYAPTLTEKYFFLIIRSKTIENPSITDWGVFFNANLSITYIYIVLSTLIIVRKSIKDYKILKGKVVLILLAPIITATVSILSYSNLVWHSVFDLTPASFSIFILLIAIAVFKYKFFDVVPYAAMDIFQNLDEAVFMLDSNNNIVEFNKAAKAEFGKIVPVNRTDNISIFFSELKKSSNDIKHIDEITKKISDVKLKEYHSQLETMDNNNPTNKKRFVFYLKTIVNERGEELGRIASFKNNTASSLVLLENERSRISGDIHDNLSNMINVVSMNLEYGIRHFENKEDALACILTAHETAKGIRINLRRILEELAPLDIERVGLFNALESLFKKIDGTGAQIDFFHSGIDDETISNQEHAYVIYKTCMEALNNSFFSGKAKRISFVLSHIENTLRLIISDDGVGCELINKGRGLIGMEKRIHSLGGSVAFESSIDEGFNISVEIPC